MEPIKYKGLEVIPIMREMIVWDNNESLTHRMFVMYKIKGGGTTYPYKCVDADGCTNDYKNSKEIEPTTTKVRTIEDGLNYGDIIIDSNSNKRKILAVINDIIIPSLSNEFNKASGTYTLLELINDDYKLYQEPAVQHKEVTLEEAKELLNAQGVKIINL